LTISADEFDNYDVFNAPISIAFHLREFNVRPGLSFPYTWHSVTLKSYQATIAYAESMSLTLDVRFTDPAAPLFIDTESDGVDGLFVVSTNAVPDAPASTQSSSASRRRPAREEQTGRTNNTRVSRRPQKVVEIKDNAEALARPLRNSRAMLPPSLPLHASSSHTQQQERPEKEPLFFPSSTQLSAADMEALQNSGLGNIEEMDSESFHAMFDDEGVEVEVPRDDSLIASQPDSGTTQESYRHFSDERIPSLELVDEIAPTQNSGSSDATKARSISLLPLPYLLDG
jgi:cell cycle checkpoint control protein RAD9A